MRQECCLEELATPQLLRVMGLSCQNFFVVWAILEVFIV